MGNSGVQQKPRQRDCNQENPLSVTVLMPCLNEGATIGQCVRTAIQSIAALKISGEVIVSDNGSTDDSVSLATAAGARVVCCREKGYGSAIRFGVSRALNEIIVVADCDGTYDFGAIEPFVQLIAHGADLVIGNRFAGGIIDGAMPWKNRYIGNPILSGISRLLFRSNVADAHCGMRSFRKTAYGQMGLKATGMEFATEQIVRATLLGFKIAQTPVTLYPDTRYRRSHLRPWRDGWRHLRLMINQFLEKR